MRTSDLLETDTHFLDGGEQAERAVARIVVEEPGRPSRVVCVAPGGVVRVGRDEDLEVTLGDARVSRLHATLRYDGRAVVVRDLGSRNGTWLGGRRVAGAVAVAAGAHVLVGGARLIVVLGADPGAEATEGEAPAEPAARTARAAGPEGARVVAVDPTSVALFALVRRLAASDLPVLVHGEPGSGKETVARALHRHGAHAGGPFVVVDCAALPAALTASERGAGVFDRARGGTLLLDEVGALPRVDQVRLLHALREHAPRDARVVATTQHGLAAEVARGRFLDDLHLRLSGLSVGVPPLRARPRDVLPLAEQALADAGGARLGPGVVAALEAYRWPGNVRELLHALRRAAALAADGEVRVEHLPPAVRAGA